MRMVNLLLRFLNLVALSFWVVTFPLFGETEMATESTEPPPADQMLEASIADIESLAAKGALLEAKERYKTFLGGELPEEIRAGVRKSLEDLNLKILFSPTIDSESFEYEVKKGDSLYKIAKEHGTTIELLEGSNHLASDLIKPGMKLKVSKAQYSIRVNKSENKLYLYSGEELLKTYSVATGSGERTPIGAFTIVNKLVDPVWYKAGAVVPAGSPENILGTRWLGFSVAGYGIHGTTMPESIGKSVTEGCIRMYNNEAEELYAIVPVKTKVTVVE